MFRDLSLKAVMVGMLGSAVVTMSSMYTALKMGALPWPTVFSAMVAFFLLRRLGNASLREVNVAHTGMSAGGLVAGGMAFTIPAIWILKGQMDTSKILVSGLVGVVLGVGLTSSMRRRYVIEEDLPFPMGIAAAQTLKAGDERGEKAKILFSWMGLSSVFTFFRDGLHVIPTVFFGFGMFPMAIGIGFIIGVLYTMSWLAGGMFSLALSHWFSVEILRRLGVGLLIGGGLAMAISGVLKSGFKLGSRWDLLVLLLVYIMSFALGLGPLSGALMVIFGYLVVLMAGAVDGTTGIDPMEVFAIIVLMLSRLFVSMDTVSAIAIAGVVAVATGLAGDALQDLKTGRFFGTDHRSQIFSEFLGAIVGVFVSVLVLASIKRAYGSFGPGTGFPAPQAFAVSQMVSGTFVSPPFWIGIAVGFIAQLFKIPALTFGIGVYLPLFITLPVALGGIIRILFNIFWKEKIEEATIASSGILGGEGVTGVLIGVFLALFKSS